ncbi:MAG TPA: hydantoinase/oxoprolinase family protein [Dongiaceae bacterium]|nr:hydantoinase/oxoprolinase family protein [Dongiaceae bacterium]
MPLLLGFDTGGTYTDAVLFDPERGVLAAAKSLTTKHDLALGLAGALKGVLPAARGEIAMVGLSTTLATNAIVEGHASPICLLLAGYEPAALDRAGLRRALGSDPVAFVAGGHQPTGDEQHPLDLEAAAAAIRRHAPKVAAFAVSAYFSVRNPAHEIALRQLVRELTDLPVTCGHELTSRLDAPRRALTSALNARLIPQLRQLVRAVLGLLEAEGITAPLMVVKGDGSLIEAGVAMECPVETILSGPAASVVGARYLSGEDDVVVADMGGTTTDIALLSGGRPVLNREGATVGGFRTMVEAVGVHTFGLGGDSEVRLAEEGLVVGPRRVMPLSLLGHQHPALIAILRQHRESDDPVPHRGQFALRQRPLDAGEASLNPTQAVLWTRLADGPQALADLISSPGALRALGRLVDRGLVLLSGFTPSDAAHLLGMQDGWSVEAARLGAEIFLRQDRQGDWHPPKDAEAFARQVREQVVRQSGQAIFAAAIAEEEGLEERDWGRLGRRMVDRSLARETTALVETRLALARPLVAIGAPVASYYPEVAERLHTRLVIPPHAGVTNALGAVAGGVMQAVDALITQPSEGRFRLHLPSGVEDFDALAGAAERARIAAGEQASAQARRAGATDVQLSVTRKDTVVREKGGSEIFIESRITATAFGRPRLAQ